MRIGVIRGDMPGPVFIADLEPTSQTNFPTEPMGQTRYVSRPTADTVGPLIAKTAATLVSTATITYPVTINGANNVLKIRGNPAAAFTSVTVANAVYADQTTFLAAINAALLGTGFTAVNHPTIANRITLKSDVLGEGAYLGIDSVAGGSIFNTPAGLGAAARNFTVPTSGATITATLPVGGPLNVSVTNLRTTLGAGLTVDEVEAFADIIAPQFVETNTVLDSFLVGNIQKLLSASYNPDPNRIPAIATGAAITVVTDDGTTLFTSTTPTLVNAQVNVPAPGAVTLTGTGLASVGTPNAEVLATTVTFYVPGQQKSVSQQAIVAAGGTVSATSIVIPASKVPGGVIAGVQAQVQYKSFVSNKFTLV